MPLPMLPPSAFASFRGLLPPPTAQSAAPPAPHHLTPEEMAMFGQGMQGGSAALAVPGGYEYQGLDGTPTFVAHTQPAVAPVAPAPVQPAAAAPAAPQLPPAAMGPGPTAPSFWLNGAAGQQNPMQAAFGGQPNQMQTFPQFVNQMAGTGQNLPLSALAQLWGPGGYAQQFGTGPQTSWQQNPYAFGDRQPMSFGDFMNRSFAQYLGGTNQFLQGNQQQNQAIQGQGQLGLGLGGLGLQYTQALGAPGVPGSMQVAAQLAQDAHAQPYQQLFGNMIAANVQQGQNPGQAVQGLMNQGFQLPAGFPGPTGTTTGHGPGQGGLPPLATAPNAGAGQGPPGQAPQFGTTVPPTLQGQMSGQTFGALNGIYHNIIHTPGAGVQMGQGGVLQSSGPNGTMVPATQQALMPVINSFVQQAMSSRHTTADIFRFMGHAFGPTMTQQWMNQSANLTPWYHYSQNPATSALPGFLDALQQQNPNVTLDRHNVQQALPFLPFTHTGAQNTLQSIPLLGHLF